MEKTYKTSEEAREKNRQYYQEHREQILARAKKRNSTEEAKERGRKYRAEHKEERRRNSYKHFLEKNDEAYRAERRAKYAAKHANDPMTEHRRRCIEAANQRMRIPLEERRRLLAYKRAAKAARKDMKA